MAPPQPRTLKAIGGPLTHMPIKILVTAKRVEDYESKIKVNAQGTGIVLEGLKKRPFDYFKDFYADTAVFGSKPATECGLAFYGEDKVLFASDSPFDPEKGPGYIRDTMKVLSEVEMSNDMREKINFRNAQKLLGVK